MKLKNPFSTETRWLFFDYRYTCANCGGNGQDCGGTELHHIRGRISDSKLNGIVLCKNCHNKIGHTNEEEAKYLQYTIKRFIMKDIKLIEKDLSFYRDNEKLYNYEITTA